MEVYYDLYRSLGKEKADMILSEIRKRPIAINAEVTDNIFAEAGRMKASYKISFADSFALAQALVLRSELLTTDHHEFNVIESKEDIHFHWVR